MPQALLHHLPARAAAIVQRMLSTMAAYKFETMVTPGIAPDLPSSARRELNQIARTDLMILYMLQACQEFVFLAPGIQKLLRIYMVRNGFLQRRNFRKQALQLQGYVHIS